MPAEQRQARGSQADELRRLKAAFADVTEERDILKSAALDSPGSPGKVRIHRAASTPAQPSPQVQAHDRALQRLLRLEV